MNFENIIIGISAFLYFLVSLSYMFKNDWVWALIWLCYSLANIGLTIISFRK
jgi:hypothetical protein